MEGEGDKYRETQVSRTGATCPTSSVNIITPKPTTTDTTVTTTCNYTTKATIHSSATMTTIATTSISSNWISIPCRKRVSKEADRAPTGSGGVGMVSRSMSQRGQNHHGSLSSTWPLAKYSQNCDPHRPALSVIR